MMINSENYELFAIDYIEGRLDKEAQIEMEQFLENHPEIKIELFQLNNFQITPDLSTQHPDKASLLKKRKYIYLQPYYLLRIASAIVVLLAIGFLWTQNDDAQSMNSVVAESVDPVIENENKATEEVFESSPNEGPIIFEETVPLPEQINTEQTASNTITLVGPKVKDKVKTHAINVTGTNSNEVKDMAQLEAPNVKFEDSTDEKNEFITEITSNERLPISTPETLLPNSIETISITNSTKIPLNLIAQYKTEGAQERKKESWFINAITKKADGTKIFAFEGVRRALTPTRYRDAKVDKSSSDSPIKQLTND